MAAISREDMNGHDKWQIRQVYIAQTRCVCVCACIFGSPKISIASLVATELCDKKGR